MLWVSRKSQHTLKYSPCCFFYLQTISRASDVYGTKKQSRTSGNIGTQHLLWHFASCPRFFCPPSSPCAKLLYMQDQLCHQLTLLESVSLRGLKPLEEVSSFNCPVKHAKIHRAYVFMSRNNMAHRKKHRLSTLIWARNLFLLRHVPLGATKYVFQSASTQLSHLNLLMQK